MLIVRMHIKHGNRWCDIAKEVEGRTDNAIKNRYNSNLSKRLHEPQFACLFKSNGQADEILDEPIEEQIDQSA